ncbi:MAG: hypothetical protein P8Y93_14235 [Acidobacteriota bacterium]
MISSETDHTTTRILLVAALIVSLLGIAVIAAGADNPAGPLTRKVQIMEKIFDEVLVQSENVYVSPGGSTRGLVLEGYGALFTIEGNLGENLIFGLPASAEDAVVLWQSGKGGRDTDRPQPEKRSADDWTVLRKEAAVKAKANLEGLKKELAGTLVDYGPTLSELPDSSWVAVALFVGGRSPFSDGQEETILIRISMRDLRSFASGSLSRDAAIAKVTFHKM